MRLKKHRMTFAYAPTPSSLTRKLDGLRFGKELSKEKHKIASMKLDKGPASATQSMLIRGLRKLEKFTGTGLAQPMGPKNIINNPKGSK